MNAFSPATVSLLPGARISSSMAPRNMASKTPALQGTPVASKEAGQTSSRQVPADGLNDVFGEALRHALDFRDYLEKTSAQRPELTRQVKELMERLLAGEEDLRKELAGFLSGTELCGTDHPASLPLWFAALDPAAVGSNRNAQATSIEPSKLPIFMHMRLELMLAAADNDGQADMASGGRIAQALAVAAPNGPRNQSVPDLVYMTNAASQAAGATLENAPEIRRFVGVDAATVNAFRQTLGRMQQSESAEPGGGEISLFSPEAPVSSLSAAMAGLAVYEGPAHATTLSLVSVASGVAEANPSVLLDPVAQARAVLADMAEQLQGGVVLDSERMRAVLHLDPPALGRVHIQLAVDDTQRIVAVLNAEDPGTQDFLQQHQSDLRQELARQGFDPDRIDLAFDSEQASAFEAMLNADGPRGF